MLKIKTFAGNKKLKNLKHFYITLFNKLTEIKYSSEPN